MPNINYSQKTQDLIDRMCRNIEREDFVLDKKNAEESILQTYDLFNLKRPSKIVWLKDVYGNRWRDITESTRSTWATGSTESARSTWAAGSAGFARSTGFVGSAESARAARSAWSTGSARAAGSTGSVGSAESARSAKSAGSAESARAAWAAGSTESARSARSAWSAWSNRSTRSTRSVGSTWYVGSARSALDYDFDWYIFEFEYYQNPDKDRLPNENDKKYLEYCELLMQAKEYGLGYRIEWEDTLYLAPTPLVKIDRQNRFHSATEPSIRWKGGKEFYFWHGVKVPEKYIMSPDKITCKEVLEETNIEIKRCLREKLGTEKFAKLLGLEEIDKDTAHNQEVILYKSKSKDPIINRLLYFVKVTCRSTGREYILDVPESATKNSWSALSWTFGKKEKEYQPLIET